MVKFSNENELGGWLRDRPAEWSVVIAARAALRALPLLAYDLGPRGGGSRKLASEVVLPVLRGAAIPWSAAAWPRRGVDLADAAANANDAVNSAGADTSFTTGTAAAFAACWAAATVADLATSVGVGFAPQAAAAAADFATDAASDDSAGAAADTWTVISADATQLQDGAEKSSALALK